MTRQVFGNALRLIDAELERHDDSVRVRQERAALIFGHYPKKKSCRKCKKCRCQEDGLAREDF